MEHETDKCDESHTFMGESFLRIYERYLEPVRDRTSSVLELGVQTGASLRMWRDYFPEATVYGVDIDPDCASLGADRIEILIASQDDEAALTALSERVGGFDLVVDDASHINALTRASFRILFPHVRPGGFYAIEDLGMSHVNLAEHADDPSFMRGQLELNRARGVVLEQDRSELDALFSGILFDLDMMYGDVRTVQFWSGLVVIQKGRVAAS